jgi:glutamate---cysteine ligase / carboxylate-amine ligase
MTTRTAEATPLAPEYLRHFGASTGDCRTAGELWGRLRSELDPPELAAERPLATALDVILQQGPLARRILRAWDRPTTPERLREVYRELCACLAENRPLNSPAVE